MEREKKRGEQSYRRVSIFFILFLLAHVTWNQSLHWILIYVAYIVYVKVAVSPHLELIYALECVAVGAAAH